MKKIALVTGISGQDGAYLAQLLLKKNYKVVGADRRSSRDDKWRLRELGIENKIIIEYFDLCEITQILRLFEKYKFDEVYNLAAQSFVGSSFTNPLTTSDVTGLGVLRLLEAIRNSKKKPKFYQASSSEMFGRSVDSDGYQTVLWEFDAPIDLDGYFVDAKIGDLDGNGVPELVIVMNLMKFADNNTPHVFIATYDWDGTHFSELPSTSLDIGKENRSLRCNNFQLLDQDGDGDQELVLALGSPFRGFAIINSTPSGLSIEKKIRPDQLLVGSGLLYIGVVDYDYDGYEDIIALSQDGNILKARSEKNGPLQFCPGRSAWFPETKSLLV